MGKITEVQQEMIAAMTAKNSERKDALSMLLSALKAKEKDKREPLTEDEENSIIAKEIKQTKETLESAPKDRTDIISQCEFRISVLSEFAPKMLSEDEIKEIIKETLNELGLTSPTGKDRGIIMKTLMPKVSGKSDGSLVSKIVGSMLS